MYNGYVLKHILLKLTMLLWVEVPLQIVFPFSNPTVTVEYKTGPIGAIVHSNNNL